MKTLLTLTAYIPPIRILNHLPEKHHILFSFLFIFFIFYCNVARSQAPPIQWQKSLGGSKYERVNAIQQTDDGGYIIAGESRSNNGNVVASFGDGDFWIVKLNICGAVQWVKSLGGAGFESPESIQQTSDGGFIVAGVSTSTDGDVIGNHGGHDFWIIKLDVTGNTQWKRCYGGSGSDWGYSIQQTKNGGYIIAGQTDSYDGDLTNNKGKLDFWVLQLDISGNIQWQKNFGGADDDGAYSIQQTSDGGFVVAGITFSNNGDVSGYHDNGDGWIIKLDNAGVLQWQRAFGGTGFDSFKSIKQTPDGGYIVFGSTQSSDGDVTGNKGAFDSWIVKLNTAGVLQWQKPFGGSGSESGFSVQQTLDGGYITASGSTSNDGDVTANHGDNDCWVVKLDNIGNISWQQSLGGSNFDFGKSVSETKDGGYIIGANSSSNNGNVTDSHGDQDYWIVKLGNIVPIPVPSINITSTSTNICAGANITFNATPTNGGTTPAYQWKKNGVNVGTNSQTYTDAVLSNNDKITCELTSNDPCAGPKTAISNEITITVGAAIPPTISISSTVTNICSGGSVTFTATPTNGGSSPVYRWKKNGINVGTNSATYTDAALSNSDKITCELTGNDPCANPKTAISNEITITVGAAIPPTISITSTATNICSGSSVAFTATPTNGGTTPIYQWKKNGVNVGTNSVTYTDAALSNNDKISCELTSNDPCANPKTAISNDIIITAGTGVTPTVSISSTATVICLGSSVTFTATPIDGGTTPIYQWKKNGTNVGNNSVTYADATLNNNDKITCELTSNASCASSATVVSNVITVSKALPVSVSISSSATIICKGDKVTISAIAANAGQSPVYTWLLNGVDAGNNSAIYTTTNLSDKDEITCIVAPQGNSCSTDPVSSNVISVTINPLPVITINPADTTVVKGSQVTLNALINGNISSYQWSPASGLISTTTLSPTTIPVNTEKEYWLFTKNEDGCAVDAKAVIRVANKLLIPNSFSPNGDGLNDVFRIPSNTAFRLNDFSVYNRWGQRIFFTTDINKGWNGLNHPVDTYLYIINGTDNTGRVALKGTVMLIR